VGCISHINWSKIKSGEEFESLCNKILHYLIGDKINFIPYGTKGRDAKIDAEYEGEFLGRRGKWIFQCKFRNPARDSSKNRSELISLLKNKELPKVKELHKLNYYCLMTNVKFTPIDQNKFNAINEECPYEVIIFGDELKNA